jgi:hypothetical protein
MRLRITGIEIHYDMNKYFIFLRTTTESLKKKSGEKTFSHAGGNEKKNSTQYLMQRMASTG